MDRFDQRKYTGLSKRRRGCTCQSFFCDLALGIGAQIRGSFHLLEQQPYVRRPTVKMAERSRGSWFLVSEPLITNLFGRVPTTRSSWRKIWFFTGGRDYAALSVVETDPRCRDDLVWIFGSAAIQAGSSPLGLNVYALPSLRCWNRCAVHVPEGSVCSW